MRNLFLIGFCVLLSGCGCFRKERAPVIIQTPPPTVQTLPVPSF